MNISNFTEKSREVLSLSYNLARSHDHQLTRPIHLFSILIEERYGLMSTLLNTLGIEVVALKTDIDKFIDSIPKSNASDAVRTRPSTDFTAILKQSRDVAKLFNDDHVKTEYMMLALLNQDSDCKQISNTHNLAETRFRNALIAFKSSN